MISDIISCKNKFSEKCIENSQIAVLFVPFLFVDPVGNDITFMQSPEKKGQSIY